MDINKVYLGDCLEIMPSIPDKSIDLTITSPPYDNLRTYGGNLQWDFEGIAKELFRVTKDGGVVVWVVGDATIKGSETGTSFRQALYFKEIGFNLHDTMIWDKGSFAFPSIDRYHQVFEYMFVFSNGKPKSFNSIIDRRNIYSRMGGISGRNRDGSRRLTGNSGKKQNEYGQRFNIWRFNIGGGHITKDKIAYQHPAIFPEQLAYDHIISWSNAGDIILDPMAGSGTVGKMAKQLNRNYILIEKEPKYYDIILKRLSGTQPRLLDK